MTPLEYLKKVGRKEADATARRAKLSPGYFSQICYGHRRASVDAAQRLVRQQNDQGAMTLETILLHKVRRKRSPHGAASLKAKSKV